MDKKQEIRNQIDSLVYWVEEINDILEVIDTDEDNTYEENLANIWNALNLIQKRAIRTKNFIDENFNID
jgi:hypothetical protein